MKWYIKDVAQPFLLMIYSVYRLTAIFMMRYKLHLCYLQGFFTFDIEHSDKGIFNNLIQVETDTE